jgi:hypothetical protein
MDVTEAAATTFSWWNGSRAFPRREFSAEALLKMAISVLKRSARAYHRVRKIARAVADRAGSPSIETTNPPSKNQWSLVSNPAQKSNSARGIQPIVHVFAPVGYLRP